jgi:cell division protein FtsI/penicillin-binding protein 2
MNWRHWFLVSGIIVAFAGLTVNLYHLQINQNNYFTEKAAAQYGGEASIFARRGTIFITNADGEDIAAALNKEYPGVFAVPDEIEEVKTTAYILSPIVGIEEEELVRQFSKEGDKYEELVKRASDELVEQIKIVRKEAGLKGIYIDRKKSRFNPFDSFAAHVLGYVGESDDDKVKGRYGIESQFDSKLAGENGEVRDGIIRDGIPGDNIYLTLDQNIQAQAEEVLENLVDSEDASGGTIIVQDPRTGKILALANAPTFNPNNYGESDISSFLNPAIQNIYEPGSIFKVITMAIGLHTEVITPATTFYDKGSLTLNGYTIKNWDKKAHGTITMTEVIEGSVNTGASFVESKIGHDTFREYLEKFHLEELTDIQLPGEVTGSIENLRGTKQEINFATAAFGQGVAVTPIRLIAAVSALANDGVMMRPYIMADKKPKIEKKLISRRAADEVTDMMVSAVKKAYVGHIKGYKIAGKTGTAQIAGKGGYTGEFIHTYVGFAPASNPQFTILVKLDKPQYAQLAGATVVPAFRELAEFMLNYYNIPPDDLE